MPLFAIALAVCAASPTHAEEAFPLIDAIRRQAKSEVRTLLARRALVNAAQPDGATALHWAAHLNDVESVTLLIAAGANVNAANQLGATPLYLAGLNRNQPIIDALLAGKANPNAALASGETVLMTAARTGDAGIVRALLARGADANVHEGAHGQSALMWAAASGHAEVVNALLSHGANVHARSHTRQRRVLVGPRGQMAGFQNTVVADLGGFTPLLFAAINGSVDVAQALLAGGANVNDEAPTGASALVIAAHSGHGGLARFLLEKGADPNADKAGYTALHMALLRRDPQLVEALLARGAKPDAPMTNGTPVGYFSRDYALTVQLVGATPFWLAAQYLEPDVLRKLAAAGATPNAAPENKVPVAVAIVGEDNALSPQDRRGASLTPAEVSAIIPGAEERLVLQTLEVASSVGVDLRVAGGRAGDTALHKAAGRGYLTVLQYLVDKGVDIDTLSAAGETPLHVAAANGHIRTIEWLASKGTDLNVRNKAGLTPLGVALSPVPRMVANAQLETQRRAAAEVLRKLGARD